MKLHVYVETTIVSYLTARESQDPLRTAHQRVTSDWWATRGRFHLYVSEAVLEEAGRGDPDAARRRIEALAGIEVLRANEEAKALARALLEKEVVPHQAALDAVHISLAAVNGMNVLLTWNCKHIANAILRPRIESTCRQCGFDPPAICTPLELYSPDEE